MTRLEALEKVAEAAKRAHAPRHSTPCPTCDALAILDATPDDWQDISTAPKDETEILTWSENSGVSVDHFHGNNHRYDWNYGEPTHWRPLPEAPR